LAVVEVTLLGAADDIGMFVKDERLVVYAIRVPP